MHSAHSSAAAAHFNYEWELVSIRARLSRVQNRIEDLPFVWNVIPVNISMSAPNLDEQCWLA